MAILNYFQKRILQEISASLSRNNIVYEVSYDGGPQQFAIVMKVLQYTLWIYPDEANIEGPDLDKRFEKYDFNSAEDLASSYIEYVKRLIRLA